MVVCIKVLVLLNCLSFAIAQRLWARFFLGNTYDKIVKLVYSEVILLISARWDIQTNIVS